MSDPQLDPKASGETILITFDFAPLIAALGLSDSSLGSPAVTLDPHVGVPPVVGLTQVDLQVVGTKVHVWAKDGAIGMIYRPACFATLSNAERRRLIASLLIVE